MKEIAELKFAFQVKFNRKLVISTEEIYLPAANKFIKIYTLHELMPLAMYLEYYPKYKIKISDEKPGRLKKMKWYSSGSQIKILLFLVDLWKGANNEQDRQNSAHAGNDSSSRGLDAECEDLLS